MPLKDVLVLPLVLGFFAGVAVSVVIAHQKISAGEYKNLKEAAKIAGIVAAPFAGLAAAKQINNQLDA